MRESFEGLSEEVFAELGRIKNPTPNISDICTKFVLMLFGKGINWDQFKLLTSKYHQIKTAISNFAPELLNEETLTDLLPLWKNYNLLHTKIHKISKG